MYTWIWDCQLNGTQYLRLNQCWLLSTMKIFHGNYSWWAFNTFSTVGDRWKPLSFKKSILNMLSCWFGRQTPHHSRVCRRCFHTYYQLKAGVHNDNTFNYQYCNWLFGFTLTLRVFINCHYNKIDNNNNNDDNIQPFSKVFYYCI